MKKPIRITDAPGLIEPVVFRPFVSPVFYDQNTKAMIMFQRREIERLEEEVKSLEEEIESFWENHTLQQETICQHKMELEEAQLIESRQPQKQTPPAPKDETRVMMDRLDELAKRLEI